MESLCLICSFKLFTFSNATVDNEATDLNICQNLLLPCYCCINCLMTPQVFISKWSHIYKVWFCKLILLSKQTDETATWSRAIAVAPRRESTERQACCEQTGSPQCSSWEMQLFLHGFGKCIQYSVRVLHMPNTFIAVNHKNKTKTDHAQLTLHLSC